MGASRIRGEIKELEREWDRYDNGCFSSTIRQQGISDEIGKLQKQLGEVEDYTKAAMTLKQLLEKPDFQDEVLMGQLNALIDKLK